MIKIEKLMKEYKEAQEFANKDLSAWPVATRPGAEMRKRECKETVKRIEAEYAKVLKAGSFAIFPVIESGGPEVLEQFLATVKEAASPLTISADALYASLAKDIEPTMGDRRTFGTTQVVRLIALLTDLGRDLDVRNIPVPQQFDLSHCPDRASLIARVRSLVRSMIGDRLNKAFIETEIVKNALSIRYTRSIIPVVVTDATEAECESLGKSIFSGTSFTVRINPNNIDKENVLKTLSDIKKAIKKQ